MSSLFTFEGKLPSLYYETPIMERTDRESSEEWPRHRTFRSKLLSFSRGGPYPFD